VGLPLLAYGAYNAARAKPHPTEAVDPMTLGTDVVRHATYQDQIDRGRERVGKALTEGEKHRLDAQRAIGRTSSLVSGTLGLTALGLRAPGGARALANRGVKGARLVRLAGHEGRATGASNTLGIGAIGVGSAGSFNYAAQQKLERKRDVSKGLPSALRARGASAVSDYAEGRLRTYRLGRGISRDVASIRAGSNVPTSILSANERLVRARNPYPRSSKGHQAWNDRYLGGVNKALKLPKGLLHARDLGHSFHAGVVGGSTRGVLVFTGTTTAAAGAGNAKRKRLRLVDVEKRLRTFDPVRHAAWQAARNAKTAERAARPVPSVVSRDEFAQVKRNVDIPHPVPRPPRMSRADRRHAAAAGQRLTPRYNETHNERLLRWQAAGSPRVGSVRQEPKAREAVKPAKRVFVQPAQIGSLLTNLAGVGVASGALAARNAKSRREAVAKERSSAVDTGLGATAGFLSMDAASTAGGWSTKRLLQRHRNKNWNKKVHDPVWNEFRRKEGFTQLGEKFPRDKVDARTPSAQNKIMRKYPLALPGGRGQRLLAWKNHPGVTAGYMTAGALGGVAAAHHARRKAQMPVAKAEPRRDAFLRRYGDRISPDAERGYRTLKHGRNEQGAQAVGQGVLAGLATGVAGHEIRAVPRNKLTAAAATAGAAASVMSAVSNARGAVRYHEKMGKIKAKARSRQNAGLYGPGRGLTPVDTTSARARNLAKAMGVPA